MSTFDHIFRNAESSLRQNKEEQQKRDEEKRLSELRKKQEIENLRLSGQMIGDPQQENCSNELYHLILNFGFSIQSYTNHMSNFNDSFDELAETYYCAKGFWEFSIAHYTDVDIPEGIFAVREISNKVANEVLSFYCDLGCRNTSESRLQEFLNLLQSDSFLQYKLDAYQPYLQLPQLLSDQGYTVEPVSYDFMLSEPQGYLDLGDSLYIKFYRTWSDQFQLVVTNNSKWNINSSNDGYDGIGYYFQYRTSDDITELVSCIEAFKSHALGHIGYYENNQYFSNDHVLRFFKSLKKDCPEEAWNHHHIRLDHHNFWDGRGFASDPKNLNKYVGLELYTVSELRFNDAAQWSIGDYINTSVITFEYDKRKNAQQCRLQIKNYIHHRHKSLRYYNDDEEQVYDDRFLVDHIELFGSFTELMDSLQTYVHAMITMHCTSHKE